MPSIRTIAEGLADELRDLREHLHAHPEPTGSEYATTGLLAERVDAIGLKPHFAGADRGCWCDINGGGSGDGRILIRGDIDALPIQTELTNPYRSTVEGVMHACGHDIHATIAFGAAKILATLRDRGELTGNYRTCFQPSEEDSTGGLHMIAAGVTEGCTGAIAAHVDPGRPVGTIGVIDGPFTAGCELFAVKFHGRGGHGARPHQTDDALTAAVRFVESIYVRVPRSTNALEPVVVNVGTFVSGVAPNVVPGTAELTGTLRSVSAAGADAARETMRREADAIAAAHRCEHELSFGPLTPPQINAPAMTARVAAAASELYGPDAVDVMGHPSMGAEDFAFIGSEVPASAMFRLGIADASGNLGHSPLHTPTFDVDPGCLVVGAAVLAAAAVG